MKDEFTAEMLKEAAGVLMKNQAVGPFEVKVVNQTLLDRLHELGFKPGDKLHVDMESGEFIISNPETTDD